ncbi:MAG: NAD(P)H-hydrate dehydratase [Dehalococcoidales bacterium]|nr:NAD(P)H-hydrate dehydratase [Dehalococcoidales bacterium]
MKILTSAQMRQAEQDCTGLGISTSMLMENAGHAVAHEIKRILASVQQKHIIVLVGPGNNGGDGLVTARYLRDWGAQVVVALLARRSSDDANLMAVTQRGVAIVDFFGSGSPASLDLLLSSSTDAVIDAVFGTGKVRSLRGSIAGILEKVSELKAQHPALRIIALDLPSGLDADSGRIDPHCLFADNTITLGFPKPGLFQFPGAERTGKISVVNIGIVESLVDSVPDELLTNEWAHSVLPKRPLGANKGTFGRVMVVAGSINYVGAAYLAGSAAMRSGAGLVTLAAPSSLYPILASKLTEVTHLPLPETVPGFAAAEAAITVQRELKNCKALLIGCGLGQHPSTMRFVKSLLLQKELPVPVVVDADALNLLAKIPHWWRKLPENAILTPHPREFARLTGLSVDDIQSGRIDLARQKAQEWHQTVVLKGAYTVVASRDGKCRVAPFANPALASAGTGDILAGVIAGLLAQGLPAPDAAACGVYLHGMAGEMVKDWMGDAGMIASDLLPELPLSIKKLKQISAA